MEQIQVEAFIRNQSGKGPARTLRRSGQIPAVFYGPETQPISLYVRQMDLEKIFKKHSGENLFFQALFIVPVYDLLNSGFFFHFTVSLGLG